MTRKLLSLASLLCMLLPVTACGGDSGKKAKIDSFTANPSIVPTAGGEVTLTWQVRGADEIVILPDVGVVTGTSLTLVVTETTEFELVAKRDGLTRRRTATVTVTEPNMVVGTVRSMINGYPIPDSVVFIKGHDPVVTDLNGMFAVPDVATPYQLTLVEPSESFSVVYVGLTRFDPTIDYPLSFTNTGVERTSTVQGTIAQAVGAGSETLVSVDTTVFMGEFFSTDIADAGTGAYSINYTWFTPETSVPATVHALRYNTSSPIISYLYGTAETTLEDGLVQTGVNVTMTSAGTAVTNMTYSNLYQWEPSQYNLALLLGSATGTASDRGFVLPSDAYVISTGNDIAVTAPDIESASFIAALSYVNPVDNSSAIDIRTVPVGSTAQVVELLPPPRLLFPVDGGSITADSMFAVSGHPQSAKMWMLNVNAGPLSQIVIVIGTEDSIRLPDLKEIGLDYDEMDEVEWTVVQIAPRASVDDVAGPGGILGNSPEYLGFSPSHTAFFP